MPILPSATFDLQPNWSRQRRVLLLWRTKGAGGEQSQSAELITSGARASKSAASYAAAARNLDEKFRNGNDRLRGKVVRSKAWDRGEKPAERVATKGNKSESRKGKHREDLKDGKVLKSATTRTILWTRGTLTTMRTLIVGFDTERIGCTILYMLHLNLFYYEMDYIILRWIFLFHYN